ncbi:MAG: error-prone DNA polymerase [Polyangiaceae bacterium]|nr:error-prone DNA polymerase [Polyangiaceae bacterium]
MFAELLARSCFSFLRGASHPNELVDKAKELGLYAVAIADRDGLYGSVRAHTRAKELEQRVIVSAELSLGVGNVELPDPKGAAEPAVLSFLVENHQGYQNLCRLLTLAHEERPKGESLLMPEWLAAHAEGLQVLVPLPRVVGDSSTCSDKVLGIVREVFRERAFLATYRHQDGHGREREQLANEWSIRFGLPILATARAFFHDREQKELLDVLYCIRRGITLDQAGSELLPNQEAVLRSEAEMQKLFYDRPAWVERTGELAQQLRFSLSELNYRFPCTLLPGETADQKLRRLAFSGLATRYPKGVPGGVGQQVEKELQLIQKLQMASYFLSTWEVVEMARRRRILCQGRGSAANSAVCYALGITAVDPARSNLLFERFMSEERAEPPDIDIDFEHERREEVIQEIYEQYGRERAAMVSEVICYRGKSSLREVGKVLGLSLDQVARLSSTITHWDTADVSKDRLKEMGFDVSDARLLQVIRLAQKLEGIPRHLSIHVGGFVVSATPLYEVAPIEPGRMPGRTVIPWDKDDLEVLGFFKIDVLGLGILTAIRKALSTIHADGGLREEAEVFDPLNVITRIPAEDPVVYEMLCQADTVGVFQIESRAQMSMLPRLRPRKFYDLVVEVALVRPGPIQGGMVHPYLRRRNGEEPITVPHPELGSILERTLGVPLFQEQVMQISIVGAGYTGGEADQLRRDMAAWKKTGRLLRHRERLLAGFANKGISTAFGEALFEQIKGFGDYGFPESHSASFALLVYASAWQKAHYPAHFACALINSQPMGFYSPSTILQDAQRHGVQVRDVCVMRSEWDCSLELENADESSLTAMDSIVSIGLTASKGDKDASLPLPRAIRLGFRLVKGFGEAAAQRIVQARKVRAFESLNDLLERAALRKEDVERLAEAGALQQLVAERRQALWQSRTPKLEGLFQGHVLGESKVRLPPLGAQETLLLDYAKKGLSTEDHPMRHLRSELKAQGVVESHRLAQMKKGQKVQVAGVVITRQQPGTASGVVFITLEDEYGFINLVLWRRIFERFHHAARHASLLWVYGEIDREIPRNDLSPNARVNSGVNTPVIHVVAEKLRRLELNQANFSRVSRDFH